MITIRNIKTVLIQSDFYLLSEKFGYSQDLIAEYADEISELVELWQTQGFVEIYSSNQERQWGRIKSSSETESAGAVPYYIGLFHSRVLKDCHDPLLVLTFENDNLVVEMFADHNALFGSLSEKHNPSRLKAIKKTISDLIFNKGN